MPPDNVSVRNITVELTSVTIFGKSDHTICVVGGLPGCDDYTGLGFERFIELSTGDVFRAAHIDGAWRLTRHTTPPRLGVCAQNGGASMIHTAAKPTDHYLPTYTDCLTAIGFIEWVEVWKSWPATEDEIRSKVSYEIDEGICGTKKTFTTDDARKLWEIVSNAKRRTLRHAG